VNAAALGWVAIITVLFVLPPNQLAGYTFVGCAVLLGIYWFGYMRARFRGPPLGAEPFLEGSTSAPVARTAHTRW
jgi:hypothetical protein